MNKTCVITGISGYLGRNLAYTLIKAGWFVRGYDVKKLPEFDFPEFKTMEFFLGDIIDYEGVKQASKNVDIIFHLVGIMPQAKEKENIMNSINVDGTKNVLDAAVENKVKRVIFLSSCEVYGTWEEVPAKENSRVNPIGTYGKNKLECERLGREYFEKFGVEFIALRPSTIVGKNMTDYLFRNIMKGFLRFPFLFCIGNGKNRFQMSALEDVISACILSAEREELKFEIFNIGSDNPLPLKEQFQEISKKLNLKKPVILLPAKPTKTLLRILSFIGISPFVPDHFEMLDKDIFMDCAKAKKILGWKPLISNVDMIMNAIISYKEEIEKRRIK